MYSLRGPKQSSAGSPGYYPERRCFLHKNKENKEKTLSEGPRCDCLHSCVSDVFEMCLHLHFTECAIKLVTVCDI